jgi:uncharacterized membrane protein YfcA
VTELLEATVLGFAAGVLSGLFGVGGGLLFVPTFTLVLGLSQLDAQATSLAAMVPAVLLGAWSQSRYGNVDRRAAGIVGLTSVAGVAAGVALATTLDEGLLRRLFAVVLLVFAAHLVWSVRARPPAGSGDGRNIP